MEKELRLPEGVAIPGPIRLYNYQRGIADAISDPRYERVTVLKAARIGYTMTLIGAIANHVVNDPANVLCVLPTMDDCSRFMVSDVEPLFAASPTIRGALLGPKGKKSRLLAKRFAGGELRVVAAKAQRNLSAHTSRILILDEVDRMTNGSEGSPITIAVRRTMTFRDRKILMGSTPVYTETSHVIKSYETSDKRIFEVPCPECGEYREILWGDISWPEGKPDEAFWCAPCCGSVVEERHKTRIMEAGRWRATAPHVKGHAGFKINALVSPLEKASWAILAAEFLLAKDDPSLLQGFVNTVLAEGWSITGGEDLDEQAMFEARKPFGLERIPEQVLAITVGVDAQHDRLEATLIGWDEAGLAYVLGHKVIYGRWDDDQTWAELDGLLKIKWQHPFGGTIGIDAVCVDSSDGVTMEAVYSFCFARARRRIMPIKGRGGSLPWIRASTQKARAGRLWIVGVDSIKGALFSRLKTGTHFQFSDDLELEFFEQLNGERMMTRAKRGGSIIEFVPVKGRRHECLDCVVYAMAAHKILTMNWDARRAELRQEAAPKTRPRVIESAWMRGNQ